MFIYYSLLSCKYYNMKFISLEKLMVNISKCYEVISAKINIVFILLAYKSW